MGDKYARRVNKSFLGELPLDLLKGNPWSLNEKQTEIIADPIGQNNSAVELDYELIEALFAKADEMDYANDLSDDWQLERWLAPRIHSTIRVPRRLAGDTRFWAWIAMRFGSTYIHKRFANKDGIVVPMRYVGGDFRNGISRLWWCAELLRSGGDYSHVDLALKRVWWAEYVLELEYSWYKPAAIAFSQIFAETKPSINSEEVKELSKLTNAYLPLTPLEAIGFEDPTTDRDRDWLNPASLPTEEGLFSDKPPSGPLDGEVSDEAIARVRDWLETHLADFRKRTATA